jgi:hypothetical protein
MTDEPEREGGGPLAVREGASVDAYEREYMKDEGLLLYRERRAAPRWLQALLLAPAIGILLPVMLGVPGSWLAAVVVLPIVSLMWIMASVLRVNVSEGAVRIQYGLWGPTIPIAAIESADATTYEWTKFGGWGIKRSAGGEWIYNMPGDGGNAVRIVWRDAKGRTKITWIGTRESVTLAAAIAKARRALGAAPGSSALSPAD